MKILKEIVGFIIFVAFVGGALLLGRQYLGLKDSENPKHQPPAVNLDHKSEMLRDYLVAAGKPQRIEFSNLSKRFDQDIKNFKNLKIPQDKNSEFYISIQFFTDEGDNTAPLVAQIRFIDIKSGNITKEESINLE